MEVKFLILYIGTSITTDNMLLQQKGVFCSHCLSTTVTPLISCSVRVVGSGEVINLAPGFTKNYCQWKQSKKEITFI